MIRGIKGVRGKLEARRRRFTHSFVVHLPEDTGDICPEQELISHTGCDGDNAPQACSKRWQKEMPYGQWSLMNPPKKGGNATC